MAMPLRITARPEERIVLGIGQLGEEKPVPGAEMLTTRNPDFSDAVHCH
jgi:hypothetical protein